MTHDPRPPATRLDPRRPWATVALPDLLDRADLDGVPEEPFGHDGWSGSSLALLDRGDRRFILKRTSAARDWIVRATRDDDLREAWFADALSVSGADGSWIRLASPYVGSAADGDGAAILMPDLSAELIAWERPGSQPAIPEALLVSILAAAARLHVVGRRMAGSATVPWCAVAERISLLTRPAAERYRAEANPVAARFLAGWDAFDRHAPAAARGLIASLAADPAPLVGALDALPATLLHGDLKLSNVASMIDGIGFIDWQLATHGPVAVELGWLLVSNVAQLPAAPDAVLERYRRILLATADDLGLDAGVGAWDAQADLATIVGLLLRGWRKGLDAEAGVTLPTGVGAAEDLAWWSDRAIEAAGRRL